MTPIKPVRRIMGRTDLIIDFQGKQYIIEMKIWHGEEYNARGEELLLGYLKDYNLKKGCMLSFNFNKKKEIGVYNDNQSESSKDLLTGSSWLL